MSVEHWWNDTDRDKPKSSSINPIRYPASGEINVSEPRLMSVGNVRVDQCVSAVRAVAVPVFLWLRSSCYHVTEVGGP